MIFVETESVELKEKLNDNFIKVAVSFLNSLNGTIYIGVKDNGDIIGVDNSDKVLQEIADIVTAQILPNPQELIEIGTKYVDGKSVIEVKVKKGKALYYVKKYGRSATGCYIRVGSTSRSMTEEQIEKRYIEFLNLEKPTLTAEIAPRQDLTFRVFKIYLDEKMISYNDTNFYENYSLKTKAGEYNYLAYALSDQFDVSIKIAKFNGKDKQGEFVFRKEFGGCCLLKTIDDVLGYIEASVNVVRSYFDGKPQRRDEFLLDKDAVREAWINACIHNDYTTHLGPSIYLFTDHLEVFSNGNALKNISKDKFLKGISRPVNPELAKICMRLEYMEESGRGINTIVNKYGATVFEFEETYLQVNIPYNLKAISTNDVLVNVPVNVPVKTEDKVLALLKENQNYTQDEIAVKIGKTKKTVLRCINSLKEKGIIKRVGSDKSGYWEIQ